MGRILHCLVCITAMSSALSQRVFNQNPPQFTNREISYEVPPIHIYNQPITENLYPRTPESRRYRSERTQEQSRIEVGNYPHKNKRASLEQYRTESNDKVVFPGPTSASSDPQVSAECKRKGYCESDGVLNYPSEGVDKLVKRLPKEELERFQMDYIEDDVQIAQRLGGGSNDVEVPLCPINHTMIYPKSLQDKDGNWWFTINRDNQPLQGFVAELCRTPDSSCNDQVMEIKPFYKSSCEQKFVYRMVDAYDDGKRISKLLKLPGCCTCKVIAQNKD